MVRDRGARERIIRAAMELFVRKGYHGSSIKDITKKLGLTIGAFYSHFTSKGDLLLQIIGQFEVQSKYPTVITSIAVRPR